MSSFGIFFGRNFRCVSLPFVVLLVLVLLERIDASSGGNSKNSNNNIKVAHFEVYELPAIQWACDAFYDTNDNIEQGEHRDNLHPMKEKTRDLCMKLRAGELGEGTDSNLVVDENNAEGTADSSNSSIDITLLEKEKKDSETGINESHASVTTATSTETEELNGDRDDATTIENEERNYVPSAAPTSSAADSLSKYTFSVLQEGDGHETDPDGIPTRYLKMQNERRDLAKTAFEKTVAWRKENDIDTLLARPHPKYDVSKAIFPHYFCGRDDTQHVILVQRPGLMDTKLANKNNVSGEDLLFHYIYVMEYLWRIVDPAPDAIMTSIIDLTEMNISILRKREQLRIGSLFLSTMDAHFPQRSHRTFLINAPKWFGALYKIASPLLREGTKQKISILSKGKEQDEVLKHLLQDCPIPEGEKYSNVPAGIMEEELRNFCLARLEEGGVTMQPVEPV